MKQTAVEWLVEKIIENKLIDVKNGHQFIHLQSIAKEMEKEQIIDTYTTGLIDPLIMKNYKGLSVDEIKIELKKQAEKYYNETFKNEIK